MFIIKFAVGLVFLVAIVLVCLYLIGNSFHKAVKQDEGDRQR